VDDRAGLVVGAQGQEFRRELVVAVERHQMRVAGQSGLFEHRRDLDAFVVGSE
jgi:hypothetical protein